MIFKNHHLRFHQREDFKRIWGQSNFSQRLLSELMKEKNVINSGELWKTYLERCRELQKPPIAVRTYSEYMNRLIELGLARWDLALVRGKVRVFKILN